MRNPLGRPVIGALVAVLAVIIWGASSPAAVAATSVTARGEWFDLKDRYTRADRDSSVVVCWHSDTPVTHVGFEGEEVSVWESVNPGGTDGCSQPLDVDATFMTQGAHAFHVAVKRNLQPLGQSEPWTVLVDRTSPGPVSQFEGFVDDALNVTVDWIAAVDPNLRDGSFGSGTAGYSIRYRVGTGAWTGPIDNPFPALKLSGVGAGQSVDVEVTARDQVGNVAAPVTASVVLVRGAPDPCFASSPPPECQDPDDGTPVDAEPDPAIELIPDESPDSGRPDTPAERLRLVGASPACKTNRCWTTIRGRPQSWAMGMVRVEPPPGADPGLQVRSTIAKTDRGGPKDFWYFGGLSRLGQRCRWVTGSGPAEGTPTTSDCPRGAIYPYQGFQAEAFRGPGDPQKVRGNNCYLRDGSPLTPGKGCNRGTRIHLRKSTRECADVGLQVDGDTRGSCTGEDLIGEPLPSGACVEWRYVTKDHQWVLIRHPGRPIERGGWVFIPLDALPPERRTWPSYGEDGGTCS